MAPEPKKVSRRQLIKLLTATAGAATLANIPNKWVKPVLRAGVLPAHAQTSPVDPATATPSNTSTPTNTPTSTPTNTPTSTPTNTPTATATRIQHTFINADVVPVQGPQAGSINKKPRAFKRATQTGEFYSNDTIATTISITPPTVGIQVRRTISILDNTHPDFGNPDVYEGPTDATATFTGPDFDLRVWNSNQYIGGDQVSIFWEFVDPLDGTDTEEIIIDIIE